MTVPNRKFGKFLSFSNKKQGAWTFVHAPCFFQSIIQIGFAPLGQLIKSGDQGAAFLGQRIFHSERNFIKLFAVDNPDSFQISQRRGQHRICDSRDVLFDLAETAGRLFAQFINDMGAPLSTQQLQCPLDRALLIFVTRQNSNQAFFDRYVLFSIHFDPPVHQIIHSIPAYTQYVISAYLYLFFFYSIFFIPRYVICQENF